MFVPQHAKILSAGKTKTYGAVFDAMYDNRFDKYIMDHYITPALVKQKQKYEAERQQAFAENITKSITMNGGLDEYGFRRQYAKGAPITNAKELANEIASKLNYDPRRL